MKIYRVATFAAWIAACVCSALFAPLFISAPLDAGTKAPALSLPNLDGETVSLSDYTGKVVLLNFWVTT